MNTTSKDILQDLKERHKKSTLKKDELAKELNMSVSSINRYISLGYGIPNYIKVGDGKNSRVLFPLVDVANFLSQTTKTL